MTHLLRSSFVLLFLGSLATPGWCQDDPELRSGDIRKLSKPIEDWFEAETSGDTEKSLAAREDLDDAAASVQKKLKETPLLSLVDSWEVILDSGRDYSTKYRKGRVEMYDVGQDVQAAVYVPKSYNPRKEASPMVLLLGDRGDDPSEIAEQLGEALKDDYIVVVADLASLPDEEVLNSAGRLRVLLPFGFANRELRVDRNRVFLVGKGSGVSVATRYGGLFPYYFSGVALVGPAEDRGLAARNLGLLATTEVADLAEAGAWIQEQEPRDPYPTELEFALTVPWAGRAYWVQATRFDPAGEEATPDSLASFTVSVDRGSNTIKIDGDKVYQITLYLNDRIVDLDQTVHVVRNGVNYDYAPSRSIGTVLENFKLNLDSCSVFPAMINQVDLPQE